MNISKEITRKKCPFCESKEDIYIGEAGLSIQLIKDNIINLDYHNCACGAFDVDVEIEYCFMCGRKLRKE